MIHIGITFLSLIINTNLSILKTFKFSEYIHSNKFREDNATPYIHHPVSVARIMRNYYDKNHNIVHTALLHESLQHVSERYLLQMTSPEIFSLVSKFDCPIEYVESKELAILKLAHCLEELRFLSKFDPRGEKCNSISKRAQEVYIPISVLLNMESIKNELGDLTFMVIEPEKFKIISSNINNNSIYRTINYFISCLHKLLHFLKVEDYNITSRIKSPYSIYKKIKYYNFTNLNQVKDIVAIRIIINDEEETCYKILNKLHETWTHLDDYYKDFIYKPKKNGYKSLHTVLIVCNIYIEVQIRTNTMDYVAEHGTASHSKYKIEFFTM